MMPDIIWPVVLLEDGDVTMYENLAQFQGYVEAIDIDDGRYKGFDASGQRLHLFTKDRVPGLEAASGNIVEDNFLANALRDYIRAVGSERLGIRSFEQASLHELVQSIAPWFISNIRSPRTRRRRPK